MRMNERNRLMATARKPEYIEDHKIIREKFDEVIKMINTLCKPGPNPPDPILYKSQIALQELCNKVCKKWNLKQLIHPYSKKNKSINDIFLSVNKTEVIEEITEDEFSQLTGNHKPPQGELTSIINPLTRCVAIRLKIDVSRSEGELLKAFREKIRTWKKNIPQDTRQRKTEYDPWGIYDQKQSGLSLLEIARRLSGKDYKRGERAPSYNVELWPPYNRVKRAYNQALKMIQSVKPH